MLLPAACSQRHFYRPRAANVPLLRAHLHDVGAGSQSGPDGGPIFSGDLRADDSAARAGSAAQEAELEGTAGEGLMGHAVVFFHHDGV